jgi:hypothetical protein
MRNEKNNNTRNSIADIGIHDDRWMQSWKRSTERA